MTRTYKSPTAEKIIQEIDMGQFLPNLDECNKINTSMSTALSSMLDNPTDHRLHMEKVHDFLKTLWTKYDCQDIIRILDTLTFVEPPLMDLERGTQRAYREHYVHVFNVFVLGLRILSNIIKKTGDKASEILKVKDEKLNASIPEFHNYQWKERLFYLWTLISNFHDISIPITRLNSVNGGLNEFLKEFGLEVTGPTLMPYFPSNLEEFCRILGSVYQGKLAIVDNWRYSKSASNEYVHSMLRSEFIRRNHGVLSAFLMYEKTREIFLEGKNKKPLDISGYNNYVDIVLKEDVARAALSISFHDLAIRDKTCKYPRCLPVAFSEFPLTYMLILVDSLQEYLRWEGTSITGGTKFLTFPVIDVLWRKEKLEFSFCFILGKDPQYQEYIISQAQKICGNSEKIETHGRAAEVVFQGIRSELQGKIHTNYPSVNLGLWDQGNRKQLLSLNIGI
jgi:hypothetical protein